MTNILLISENAIKENSNLSDNIWGKSLLPAIREAQDIGLQSVIGQCLYEKLLDLVKTGDIKEEENIAYKDLLDQYVRDFLLYEVIANVILNLNVKLANIGTVTTNDEHITNLTQGETDLLEHNYANKADFYKKRLQQFLLNNYDAYSELEECMCNCCYAIKPNLKTTADSTLWLGGAQGK